MAFKPPHEIGKLRKGRVSIPGARYFITVCTLHWQTGLTDKPCANAIIEVLRRQHREKDFVLDCATIMPDHVHVLFHLGRLLTLSQTQAKFKSLSKEVLQTHGLSWQDNYYDHRLRYEASMEGFARYIFLNPYRKSLIPLEQKWEWWILNRNYRPEFMEALGEDPRPPKEWLAQASNIEDLIDADRFNP